MKCGFYCCAANTATLIRQHQQRRHENGWPLAQKAGLDKHSGSKKPGWAGFLRKVRILVMTI
jgi:hypothetical protein